MNYPYCIKKVYALTTYLIQLYIYFFLVLEHLDITYKLIIYYHRTRHTLRRHV